MTILREAHLDLEGLVMDAKVRYLRDEFVTKHWSQLLYDGLVSYSKAILQLLSSNKIQYFSPERELVEGTLVQAQKSVVRIHLSKCERRELTHSAER